MYDALFIRRNATYVCAPQVKTRYSDSLTYLQRWLKASRVCYDVDELMKNRGGDEERNIGIIELLQ